MLNRQSGNRIRLRALRSAERLHVVTAITAFGGALALEVQQLVDQTGQRGRMRLRRRDLMLLERRVRQLVVVLQQLVLQVVAIEALQDVATASPQHLTVRFLRDRHLRHSEKTVISSVYT